MFKKKGHLAVALMGSLVNEAVYLNIYNIYNIIYICTSTYQLPLSSASQHAEAPARAPCADWMGWLLPGGVGVEGL